MGTREMVQPGTAHAVRMDNERAVYYCLEDYDDIMSGLRDDNVVFQYLDRIYDHYNMLIT